MKEMFEKCEIGVLANEIEDILEVSDVRRKNKKLTKEEFRNLWLRKREHKWI